MTGIARKILIYAAVDGLIIQPLAQRNRPSAVKISYSDTAIVSVAKSNDIDSEIPKFEAFGIIGLLTVSSSSFLLSITNRRQVAQIFGHPIYVVTEIAITPLSSKKDAEASVSQTQRALRKRTPNFDETDDDSDVSADADDGNSSATDEIDDDVKSLPPSVPDSPSLKKKTSIAEDVIAKKGGYGRFAKNWFSKEKWRVDQLRNLGLSATNSNSRSESSTSKSKSLPETLDGAAKKASADGEDVDTTKGHSAQNVAADMLPKLLKTTKLLFGSSRSYYFSYDYDITRNLASRSIRSKDLPLHTEVDPLFFWNRSLMQPFIAAHQDSLVLPLMQGYVGQQIFSVDTADEIVGDSFKGLDSMEMTDLSPCTEDSEFTFPKDKSSNRTLLLTLISRRSVKRAGLRYLRRGVDDEGNVANNVETEQILSDPFWTKKKYSFLQVRGSIPIYFSQSPYAFKPVPQIHHSEQVNYMAFQKHFRSLADRYGNIAITSLVEKHGNEAIVGSEYEKHLTKLNEAGGVNGSEIASSFWDFHVECRGMKFENVSLLMDILGGTLDGFGYTVESDGKLEKKQTGVLRTNCMDCLDRTNVVQSAAARRALELQLKSEGIDLSIQSSTQWFNILWADNGDAISKQYASTAAMKGDYTRTRKRDYKGALTDMGISISRFYSGIVNDFLVQTCIDFLSGSASAAVFEEFETNMMSRDPGLSAEKIRQQAIDVSHKLVIEDEKEEFLCGWALLFPREPNTIKSTPFEEAVLLLTDAALYACRFDWNLEKVSSFERVELDHIINIKYGTYITSTLSAAQANEKRNVGFVITYEAGKNDVVRTNTRSLSTSRQQSDLLSSNNNTGSPIPTAPINSAAPNILAGITGPLTAPTTRIIAAKALPSGSAIVEGQEITQRLSEIEQVKSICAEIERMVFLSRAGDDGDADCCGSGGKGREEKSLVVEKEIIGLADAKKNTGLIEQLGYNIKKLVWS